MLKSIEIENFRGIKHCKIEDLSLVNIFVGKNNSGKSTVLDAIYFGCKEITGLALSTILRIRCQREVGGSEIWFGYNPEYYININLKFEEEKFTVRLRKEGHTIISSCMHGTDVKDMGRYSFSNVFSGSYTRPVLKIKGTVMNYCEKIKIFPSLRRVDDLTKDLDELLGRIKLDLEKEDDFRKRISEIYGETRCEFIPRPERRDQKTLVFEQDKYRVFAEFHGDGVKRGALFISALEVLNNTALLIEEVENYQHPEALKKLAKNMVDLARKNNVQLFITTHSYFDALKYFYHSFDPEKRRKEFRCYTLEREENGVVNVKIEENIDNIIRTIYGS